MPRALSDPVRQRVTALLQAGYVPSAIAREEGISKHTVYRIRSCLLTFGEPAIPRNLCVQSGRKFVLNQEAYKAIRTLLDAKPWAYQSEIQEHLLDEYHLAVDQSTVSRTLKRFKIT